MSLLQLPDPIRASRPVPGFTNDDATELFLAAGMPANALKDPGILGLINQAVSGHPGPPRRRLPPDCPTARLAT